MYNETTAEKLIKSIPDNNRKEEFKLEDLIQVMKNVKKQLNSNYLKINYELINKVKRELNQNIHE